MALSHDKCLLASISLDDIVKIIDVSHLGSRDKEEFDEAEYERDIHENPKGKRKNKKVKNDNDDQQMVDEEERKSGDEAWKSDSSDYGSSDDSDSDEEDQGMKGREGKKDKKLNIKGNNVKKSKKIIDNAKRLQFFSDL